MWWLFLLSAACGSRTPDASSTQAEIAPTVEAGSAKHAHDASPPKHHAFKGIHTSVPRDGKCSGRDADVDANQGAPDPLSAGLQAHPGEIWHVVNCTDASQNHVLVAARMSGVITDPAVRIDQDMKDQEAISPAGSPTTGTTKLSGQLAHARSEPVEYYGHQLTRHLRYLTTDTHFYYAAALGPGLTAAQADAWLDTVTFDELDP